MKFVDLKLHRERGSVKCILSVCDPRGTSCAFELRDDAILLQLRDGKRVAECLKKGLRFASQCMDSGVQAQLFCELLNSYVYFFEKGNVEHIKVDTLNQLIAKIKELLPTVEKCDEVEQIQAHFERTLERLSSKSSEPLYEGLTL